MAIISVFSMGEECAGTGNRCRRGAHQPVKKTKNPRQYMAWYLAEMRTLTTPLSLIGGVIGRCSRSTLTLHLLNTLQCVLLCSEACVNCEMDCTNHIYLEITNAGQIGRNGMMLQLLVSLKGHKRAQPWL